MGSFQMLGIGVAERWESKACALFRLRSSPNSLCDQNRGGSDYNGGFVRMWEWQQRSDRGRWRIWWQQDCRATICWGFRGGGSGRLHQRSSSMPNLVAVVQAENTKWEHPNSARQIWWLWFRKRAQQRWTSKLRPTNLVAVDSTKFGGWMRPNPKFPQNKVQVAGGRIRRQWQRRRSWGI